MARNNKYSDKRTLTHMAKETASHYAATSFVMKKSNEAKETISKFPPPSRGTSKAK